MQEVEESLAEIWTRGLHETRESRRLITSIIPFISSPDSDANFPATFAVIHTKEATVNETKARRTAAPLGNFVVEVALRITDARQEVGTAEAARGPGAWTRGARGRRGSTLHCRSERASEMKKKKAL